MESIGTLWMVIGTGYDHICTQTGQMGPNGVCFGDKSDDKIFKNGRKKKVISSIDKGHRDTSFAGVLASTMYN
jgi:hypothetical protein